MGWDRLFVSLWKDEYEPKVNDSNLIGERLTYVPDSDEIFIFLPPWHGKIKYDSRIKKYLKRKKISCIEYKFNGHFLSSDYKLTLKYFREVNMSITKSIKKLAKKYKFKRVNVVGVSLGCVNACVIANNLETINKLILIVPGNSLADSLWNGIKTQRIRKKMEKKGISLDVLQKAWKSLAPENNFDKLKTKKIKIYLSKADEVIPYEFGLRLVKKLKNKNVECYENRFLGHYLTAINFYLFPKKYLN